MWESYRDFCRSENALDRGTQSDAVDAAWLSIGAGSMISIANRDAAISTANEAIESVARCVGRENRSAS